MTERAGNKPITARVSLSNRPHAGSRKGTGMTDDTHDEGGISRRHALECMLWAGTGVLWGLSGGVPKSIGLLDGAAAAEAASGFTFLQISDSHVGFDKPANPHAIDTLKEAIDRIKALPQKPAFMLHTGDITHLSKPDQFDNAAQLIDGAGVQVNYVPGEHDIVDEGTGKAYLERYGKGTKGAGWYSFDDHGVHFIGLVNVANLKAGGLGFLGQEQLEWLEDDLKPLKDSTPIVVFAHIPLWSVYPTWGRGTDDAAVALGYLKRFGSVTVLNGHIHQLMQKVEGNVTFHTARSTAFPQPAPGTAPSPGPMLVPAEKLRSVLGITRVDFKRGGEALAITDTALSG
jgi:3',5'-cyclic AMP phosphodiesterase CpdA